MSSILVFDSGIGGLSVLQHIQQIPRKLDIHYIADYAAFPYGEKEEQWLIDRISKLITSLTTRIKPDAIIIACNTASTLALPTLRNQLTTPIIGVVPAIKTASTLSQNKNIGLLATPGTVSRVYMDKLIEEFASEHQVTRIGSTELVELAEQKMKGIMVNPAQLKNIIQPFIDNQCDQVVLGCTHFPLLKEELSALNSGINFVDSGEAIANRTAHILASSVIQPTNPKHHFYSTSKISEQLEAHLKSLDFQSLVNI